MAHVLIRHRHRYRRPELNATAAIRGDDSIHTDLLDGVREAILVVEPGSVVSYANSAARRLLGLRAGVPIPDSRIAAALAGASPVFEIDHESRRLSGRRATIADQVVWYIDDITEQVARSDALLAERWRSAFLAEASRRLGASLNRDRTARTTVSLAVPALADGAVVVLIDGQSPARWYRSVADTDDAHTATTVIDAERLAANPAVVLALAGGATRDDALLNDDVRPLLAADFGPIAATMVLPLPGHGATIGALILVRGDGARSSFDATDTAVIQQFTARAGAGVAAATLYGDLGRTATVLQRSLEPRNLPPVPGMVFGAGFRPARERLRIGGDFYDVFRGPDGGWTFMLGDVCGKGVDAAVQTGKTRQSLYALRQLESDPATLLRLLNQTVMSTEDPQLTTLLLGALTATPTGGIDAVIATGGHPRPLIIRHGGAVEVTDVAGVSIGLMTNAQFGQTAVTLNQGDTLIAYTDGITEARGGMHGEEFFGEQRLHAALSSHRANPAAAIAAHLEQIVMEWIGERHHDDIAILAIQPDRRTL